MAAPHENWEFAFRLFREKNRDHVSSQSKIPFTLHHWGIFSDPAK